MLYCRTNLNGSHLKLIYPGRPRVKITTPEGTIAYGITSSELQHNSTSDYGMTIITPVCIFIIILRPITACLLDRISGPNAITYTYSSLGVPLKEIDWTINAPHSVIFT